MEQENERAVLLRRRIDFAAADATSGRPRKTWQPAPPWRKLLLAIHIIVSVGLLGTDAAVLVLCIA